MHVASTRYYLFRHAHARTHTHKGDSNKQFVVVIILN
jgi:hypothetical protein